MVYLAIKELATTAEDVIMVTSSIMKDMQPNSEVIYRPNAIRALCRIIDVRSLLAQHIISILKEDCTAVYGARS
jgi:coatomer protein complex subunit gamma